MKISTISHEVVFPANVHVVGAENGSGKPAQKPIFPENSETRIDDGAVLNVEPPIEVVVNGLNQGLRFFYDRDAGIRVIQVVDQESGDVIRQIPPDEVVDFMRQFRESKGHFVSGRF
jgi:flagellar protein FlaG